MYLVIFLAIIILILILRICYFEKFQASNPGCNFKLEELELSTLSSYGEDVERCIMDCYNNPAYNNCGNSNVCQEICLNCRGQDSEGKPWDENTKQRMCPWYKRVKETNSKEPDAPIIRGYAADSSILIEWQRPYDNKSTITNYIVDVTEMNSKKKSSKLVFIKDNSCKVCEFKIKGLKNQVNHMVTLRAVNAKGIGPVSNTIEVVPNGVNTELLKNIENDINTNTDLNLNVNSYDCMNGYKYNDLSLDLINLDEINIAKHVKELAPIKTGTESN